jgi:hypothetical protein
MPLTTPALSVKPTPIALLRSDEIPHPERAVARDELIKVRRGVYAPAQEWRALAPWEKYLAQVHAVLLLQPELVPSHESAVALLGGPTFGNPGVVHVVAPAAGASRLVSGVRTHTSADDRTLLLIDGIAITGPGDAAVDIARSRHPAISLAVADAALRLDRSLSPEALKQINERRSSSRGRDIARWPLERANALSETAFEGVSRAAIEWSGFPQPELQRSYVARTGEVDRPDFVWDDASVAGESDGDLKFDGRFGDAALLLNKQRTRDARLREHVRTVVHWGWQDVITFTPLQTLLLGAGLRRTRPQNSAALLSMRQRLAARAPHPTDTHWRTTW